MEQAASAGGRPKASLRPFLLVTWFMIGPLVLVACNSSSSSPGAGGLIRVVAAEDQYGNVAAQIGGRFVSVTSIEKNPNTDPHTYEVNPGVAEAVSAAQLVIQNGLGYDDFMTKVEAASDDPSRRVINVQHLLALPDSTPNPHLWYSPKTMPVVADAVAADLATLQPAHGAYFRANAARFVTSLRPWVTAIARFKASFPTRPWPRRSRWPTTCCRRRAPTTGHLSGSRPTS